MFFVSEFLDYDADMSGTNLDKINILNPRRPQREVLSRVSVTFTDGVPSGKVYAFAESLKTTDTVTDHTGSTDYDTVQDRYLERTRVLFSFSGASATREIDFNLGGDFQVGTLLFFKESDILRTSPDLFLTYPFQVRETPRTLTITKVDGSTLERPLDDEPLLRITTNIIPAKDYTDESDDLDRLLKIISPRQPFLYVAEDEVQTMYLMKRTPGRQIDHQAQDFNRQRIQALNLEVA